MPTRREVHNSLVDGNIDLFILWNEEGKDPSYFIEKILEYPYHIRYELYKYTDWVYKTKTFTHRGWPRMGKMTAQAWTFMEVITFTNYVFFRITDDSLESLFDALMFAKSGITMIEYDYLYQNIITSMQHTDRYRSEISCLILLCFLISTEFDIDVLDVGYGSVRRSIMENICSHDKLNLFTLVTINPQQSFNEFMSWMYSDIEIPNIIKSFLIHCSEKES